MKSNFAYLSVLTLALLTYKSANAQEGVKIEVETGAARGQLIVTLCTEETFLQDTCILARATVDISDPVTTAVLVPPKQGRYAVFVVHDKNANGKMDKNFLGIPKEPVGMSRNPTQSKFGPPKFSDVSFDYPSNKPLEFRIRLVGPD
jgi:uncharacterized protein (DUF2141 family)